MGSRDPATKNRQIPDEEINYQAKVLFTSFEIRIFNLLVALIFANILKNVFFFPIAREISVILYAWLFICVIYFCLFRFGIYRKRSILDRIHYSYYIPGVFCAAGFVHYLGGVEWIAFFVYLFDLVYGNVLMGRAKGAVITALAITSYVLLGLFEYRGVIPHYSVFPDGFLSYSNPRYLFAESVMIIGGVFCLLSFSTGFLSKIKEDREKNILDSKRRFEAKSMQLEKMAKVLRKKAAENVYIKRASMGYVEKKEFELETAKKDLEDQIEKLRKTQRSMFFMIEDLNEMSAQLKDARDHLEEKVRTRTNELLEISKKLHRSERLAFLGKLAGSVTHELRNPLAVLKNAAYFLDKKFQKKADKATLKYVGVMKKEISVIDGIIDDIMGFAKTKPPKIETIDISKVINNVISALNIPDLIEIEKDFEKLPGIKVDQNQLTHALVNIANNAIMAMSGNGTMTFRTRKQGDQVKIEIEDTGYGIPPDQKDLIFEPLYSSKPKGTGLGLPIAKMMVENQNGKIDFSSDVGRGTVFRIYLPIAKEGSK